MSFARLFCYSRKQGIVKNCVDIVCCVMHIVLPSGYFCLYIGMSGEGGTFDIPVRSNFTALQGMCDVIYQPQGVAFLKI